MTSVARHIGYREGEYQQGQIGLEIETETKSAYALTEDITSYWSVHPDGSLRDNGQEFVFIYPYDFDSEKFNKALEAFDGLSKKVKFLKSVYSSVHVHFNMLTLEPTQMFNFMALYFLFEEMLTDYCGPDRNGNLFCLKTSNAEYTLQQACDLVTLWNDGLGKAGIRNLNTNALKYSSLNIACLRNLGSLEVRTHPGTTDVIEIHRWVGILNQLYVKAKTFKDPAEILKEFRYSSPTAFVMRIFEEYTSYLSIDVFKKSIRNPLWYLSKFASTIPDWSNINEATIAQPEPKRKRIKTSVAPVEPGQITIVIDEDDTEHLDLATSVNAHYTTYYNTYATAQVVNLEEDQ